MAYQRERFEKTLVLLTYILSVVEKHPDVDLGPWIGALPEEEARACAGFCAARIGNHAAAKVLRGIAARERFLEDVWLAFAWPGRYGLEPPDLPGDMDDIRMTPLDCAVYARNEEAARVLWFDDGWCPDRSVGYGPDNGDPLPRWTPAERAVCFVVAGEGVANRPAAPIFEFLLEKGSTLGLVAVEPPFFPSAGDPAAACAELDPKSETARAFAEARRKGMARETRDVLDTGAGVRVPDKKKPTRKRNV